jgi:hypothetical protein
MGGVDHILGGNKRTAGLERTSIVTGRLKDFCRSCRTISNSQQLTTTPIIVTVFVETVDTDPIIYHCNQNFVICCPLRCLYEI